MPRIQNSNTAKIFSVFLFIFTFIVFSFFNIFILIITCNDFYCYYKKCHKYNLYKKTECFLDKTDDIGDWIILNLFSVSIYLLLLSVVILLRIFYKKIMIYYITYKNKNKNVININSLNNIFEPRETETEIHINVELSEELESEEKIPIVTKLN